MRVHGLSDTHLGYCTNIHPGETWPEVRANLEQHVRAVKHLVAPDEPFGVGLRLSAAAARGLLEPGELETLRGWLDQHQMYVFTINGFPHGTFHGTRVKEEVYRPDWLEDERLRYTDALAHLLAAILPAGQGGTISTVPGCFRPRAASDGALERMAAQLLAHVGTLIQIAAENDRVITLALEPEPMCCLETVAETVEFFRDHLHSSRAAGEVAARTGLSRAAAEQALRRHIGVCLDTCHAAVEFEDPLDALEAFGNAGIEIAKIQISCGLRVPAVDDGHLVALRSFADPVYLHQVVARSGAELTRYLDLGDALAAGNTGEEWRIHFHVPIFLEALGLFSNTQGFVRDVLRKVAGGGVSRHLEVETYTWDVLPAQYRELPVVEAIARELVWAKEAIAS